MNKRPHKSGRTKARSPPYVSLVFMNPIGR